LGLFHLVVSGSSDSDDSQPSSSKSKQQSESDDDDEHKMWSKPLEIEEEKSRLVCSAC